MKTAIVCPDDISIVLFCKGIIFELKRKDGNEIAILCDVSSENENCSFSDEIKSWGVSIIPIPFYRFLSPLRDFKYIYKLYNVFRHERFDAVLNISTKPNIYGSIAAKLAGLKFSACAVWGMGTVFQEKIKNKRNLLRALLLNLYRIAFRLSDKIWFTNENDYRFLISEKIVLPEKCLLTKNYLSTRDYSPNKVSSLQIQTLKKNLRLQQNQKIVLMVARMAWTKGIKEFIEASQIVIQRMPEVRFILVGPAENGSPESVPESYLREKERKGSFSWIGFRSDIKALYAMSDLAVLPSYYREGGYPRAITEAMAMGKPVITTNSVHCCSTVEDGKNGYLVPIQDSRSLADAIENILSDDYKQAAFGLYSRIKAVNEFDEQKILPVVIKKLFFMP